MAFFPVHQWPYTNVHELNLDWLIAKVREGEVKLEQLPETVRETVEEELKKLGLEGFDKIPGQVAELQTDVSDLQTSLNNLSAEVNADRCYLTVGPLGCQYKTITEAVNAGKQLITDGKTNKIDVLIFSGNYVESINLLNNPGISFVGLGNPSIRGTKEYPEAALFVTGECSFKGITFESYVSGTYAVHIEDSTATVHGTVHFNDCRFYGDIAGIGAGLGGGSGLSMHNCVSSGVNGRGAYFHNQPTAGGAQSSVEIINTLFGGELSVYNYTTGSPTQFRFNNVISDTVKYTTGQYDASNNTNTNEKSYPYFYSHFSPVTISSVGCYPPGCNTSPNSPNTKGAIWQSSLMWNGQASIYFPCPLKYKFSVNNCQLIKLNTSGPNPSFGEIVTVPNSNASIITNGDNPYIQVVLDTSTYGSNGFLLINFTFEPK